MKVPYGKKWQSISKQLQKLEDAGLFIEDTAAAESFLRHLNYYRFSGYGLAFERTRHQFVSGATFEQIRHAYEFDRALRDLVYESMEVIELDIRTTVAYTFGETYQAFGHSDANNFYNVTKQAAGAKAQAAFNHKQWHSSLKSETKRSSERFIQHFKTKYSEHPDLPLGKLWSPPLLPGNERLFASLLLQRSMLKACPAEQAFADDWRDRVQKLIETSLPQCPEPLAKMGMPSGWQQHPIWA